MTLREQFAEIWRRGGGFFGLMWIGVVRIFAGKDAAQKYVKDEDET